MIMITPLPGLTTTKPGSATHPFPGVTIEIRNQAGEKIDQGGGLLTISRPWPAMLRGIYGDMERYEKTYWSKWPDGAYFAGDGARIDADGTGITAYAGGGIVADSVPEDELAETATKFTTILDALGVTA